MLMGKKFFIECVAYVVFIDENGNGKAKTRKILKDNKQQQEATIRLNNKMEIVKYHY